ncbi:MAG: hypothetical protein AAF229_03065 [Pseudomonadota bacterium]
MMTFRKSLCAMAALTIGLASANVSASLFEYRNDGGTFGGQGGAYGFNSIYGSYDTVSEDFVWAVDYDTTAADGGWLVLSDGPNPKAADDQLAILYFDALTEEVWAYAYNGLNNNKSYLTTDFLGYFQGAYTTVGTLATLSINVAAINDALSEGVMFDTLIGIWFHPSFNVTTAINPDGSLAQFSSNTTVWYDTKNETATEVPAPAAPLLLFSALLLLAGARRR